MRSLALLAFMSTVTYGATVELQSKSGQLCPDDPTVVAGSEIGEEWKVQLDLLNAPAVQSSMTSTNARSTCTLKFSVDPGAGYQVQSSRFALASQYILAKAGRAFWSIKESTGFDGDSPAINHTVTAKHMSESGGLSFDDEFGSWPARNIPCGQAVTVSLQLNVTARQARTATPSKLTMENLGYWLSFAACK